VARELRNHDQLLIVRPILPIRLAGRHAVIPLALVATACTPARDASREPAAADLQSVAVEEVRAGACPFECCTYGTWTPMQPVVIYAIEGDTASAADTIPTGEAFTSRTGNVHLTDIPTVVLSDTISGYDSTGTVITLQAGDTVRVLDYVGEGNWWVRSGGRVVQLPRFWHTPDRPADRGFPDIAEAATEPTSSWWVAVTRPDVRTGWLLVRKEYRFGGWDRCGGP
jgi:hypothetical protein